MLEFLLTVIIGGFIGWSTNVLAVKALFRPIQPRPIGPFDIQGLLPKRRGELAEKLGETIEQNLLSTRELASQVKPSDLEPIVDQMVAEYTHEMRQKVQQDFPNMSFVIQPLISFGGPLVARAIRQRLPEMIERGAEVLVQKVSVKKLVRDKVEQMDLEKLESVILSVSARELVWIERLGGILGMLVGVLQWGVMRLL
ncbi:MAG TPA: DUF445 family protein [Candidatus Ozemobacteraceae bacterium]|nr:DUF445 family protein [Candidatus Ozemobacteraceae bacterium]